MPEPESFPWTETYERLAELNADYRMELAADNRSYRIHDQEGSDLGDFRPPALQPLRGRDPDRYLSDCEEPGRHVILLLQAGASALGIWANDELISSKVIHKYVVRGRGRAQPLHLKTRGKSRYGSRLRLQQAKQQLIATNQKLTEFIEENGQPRALLFSVPERSWPELFKVQPPPPFAKDDPRLIRIPIHIHRPDYEELQRAHRILRRGQIQWLAPMND